MRHKLTYLGLLHRRAVIRPLVSSLRRDHTFGGGFRSACKCRYDRISTISLKFCRHRFSRRYIDRSSNDLVVVSSIERQLAAHQQEHDHADGPQVRLLAVTLSLKMMSTAIHPKAMQVSHLHSKHFGGNVGQGPAGSVHLLTGQKHLGQTEISQLDVV